MLPAPCSLLHNLHFPCHLINTGGDTYATAGSHKENFPAVGIGGTMAKYANRTHAELLGIACIVYADAIPNPLGNGCGIHSGKGLAQNLTVWGQHLAADTGSQNILLPETGVGYQGIIGSIGKHLGRNITEIFLTQSGYHLPTVLVRLEFLYHLPVLACFTQAFLFAEGLLHIVVTQTVLTLETFLVFTNLCICKLRNRLL